MIEDCSGPSLSCRVGVAPSMAGGQYKRYQGEALDPFYCGIRPGEHLSKHVALDCHYSKHFDNHGNYNGFQILLVSRPES